jgi:hypothetical protein
MERKQKYKVGRAGKRRKKRRKAAREEKLAEGRLTIAGRRWWCWSSLLVSGCPLHIDRRPKVKLRAAGQRDSRGGKRPGRTHYTIDTDPVVCWCWGSVEDEVVDW